MVDNVFVNEMKKYFDKHQKLELRRNCLYDILTTVLIDEIKKINTNLPEKFQIVAKKDAFFMVPPHINKDVGNLTFSQQNERFEITLYSSFYFVQNNKTSEKEEKSLDELVKVGFKKLETDYGINVRNCYWSMSHWEKITPY